MVNTPKRIGDDVIIENPDKRTIAQANKQLRKEQSRENGDTVRDVADDLWGNEGLGQALTPKSEKSRGEKKLA